MSFVSPSPPAGPGDAHTSSAVEQTGTAPLSIAEAKTAREQHGPLQRALRPTTLRARLIVVFALFLTLMAGVGVFGISRLSQVNAASSEIQAHWLRAAPQLGELNNLISDFRAAEAGSLLDASIGDQDKTHEEVAKLDQAITQVRTSYEKTRRDANEERLYARFNDEWGAYRDRADRVLLMARRGQRSEGTSAFRRDSHPAFSAASNTLGELIAYNVNGAQDATAREITLYQTSRGLIWTAILVSACILVAAIVFITRSVSNPLADLAQRMLRLAANQTDLEIRGVDRPDEIGAMARSVLVFRENAIGLSRSQQALREQAATLQASLDAERRVTAQQQNFISMTSHEFRTPLTIIDSHAQRLIRMKERLTPEDLTQRAQGIRSAVARMVRLIDSLLASSRVLDGDAKIQPATVDLTALVREVCQMHREVSPAARIEESIPGNSLRLTADGRLVYQALSNLVSNAIKYSPSDLPVTVALRVEAQHVRIDVMDEGMGIPPQDVAHLFERYFRGSNVSDIAGTGVGLYLVDMIAKLHHGRVYFTSPATGGACFSFELPLENTEVSETVE